MKRDMNKSKGMLHRFLVVSYETIMSVLFSLPRYAMFNYVKAQFLRLRGAKVGKNVIFYPGVWIESGRNLIVGDNVDFALDVFVGSDGGVTIGDRTLIGYRTQILSRNHEIPNKLGRIFDGGKVPRPVIIHNDVWTGANCIILPGVTVGEGSVVGAGSIVTKNVGPFSIVAGNPAKLIRYRS